MASISVRWQIGITFIFILMFGLFIGRSAKTCGERNLSLICESNQLGQDQQITQSICTKKDGESTPHTESSTLAMLDTYHLLQENPEELAAQCDGNICDCVLPLQQDTTDAHTRQINVFLAVAIAKTGKDIQDISYCAEQFSTSSYLHTISIRNTSYIDAELRPIFNEVAYVLNNEWTRPLHTALNAIDQAERYQAAGQLTEAEVAYERAISNLSLESKSYIPPYQALAHRQLADLLLSEKQFSSAQAHYEQSISALPTSAKESLAGYVTALQGGDGEIANHLYAFLSQQEIATPDIMFNTVVALTQISETTAAKQLLEMNDISTSAYGQAAQGVIARSENNFAEAEQFFEDALSNHSTIDAHMAASWAARLAVVRILQNDWEKGIEAQLLAVELSPDNPYYKHDLASFYLEQSERELALQAINEAITYLPDNAEFITLRQKIQASP
jgi:tetratricopeptide (TPR) repeat protein